jgi:signal transduction histidine kinase/DNA-binding response OmpR family regulator
MSDEKTSILIVDDLPEKILVYQSVLEELGQNIVVARSGAEALKQVLRNDFAVILLDVNMPDMDGFETARLIRQRRLSAHVPIIFLTAFADDVRTAEGYATGGVDYLPTPVVPEILRAKVRVFVDLYRLRQQVARQAESQAKRTAAEQSALRSEFLADASRTVASSLDVEATLRGLARVPVPFLADFGLTGLIDSHGSLTQIEAAWRSPDQSEPTRAAPEALRLRGALAEAVKRAAATGRPESLEGELDTFGLVADDENSGPPFRFSSALVLPLVARGEPLGTLVLAQGPSGRVFSPEDVSLADDLAARASIALDNALLVRDIQENDLRKDEFLAMLAHELRNPLAPIRTGLDLLAMSGADAEVIAPMRRQVEHLVRLVDDLLDVSRITRGVIDLQTRVVDLKKVVAGAVETSRPLIEARSHQLNVLVANDPLCVAGDPIRLTQVVTNLLNNAAKYTPDGGQISVTAERENSEIVLRVCDTGAGISREMLPNVFDLFVQADRSLDRAQGGLGIGLTLVRRIVEMHRGSVDVFSDGLGMGSEFVVRLPACARTTEELPPDPSAPPSSPSPSSFRTLVVDDNVDAAATLAMLLRLWGHEVLTVHDGKAALDAVLSFAPQVVLLDIGLPGLDGYEVARRLRELPETENAMLVAVSGYGRDEDRQRAHEAGFDHHLTKPVDFAALSAVLSHTASQVAAG